MENSDISQDFNQNPQVNMIEENDVQNIEEESMNTDR